MASGGTLASRAPWDTIIVGGGPAGLSAALVLGRARRRVLICDQGKPRNRSSSRIGGFLSRDGIEPTEFLQLARDELRAYDTIKFMPDTQVTAAATGEQGFELQTSLGTTFISRKVLIATGVADQLPPISMIDRFYGHNVWHCPYCDGYEHRDQKVAVYGRGKTVSALALELTCWTSRLTVVSDGPCALNARQRRRLKDNGIEVREDSIRGLEGSDGFLTHVVFASGERLTVDAMFFHSDGTADVQLARGLGVQTMRNGVIRTGGYGKTHVPGVFIAGDASRHVQLAIVAAGEGAAAAFAINTELLKEDLQ